MMRLFSILLLFAVLVFAPASLCAQSGPQPSELPVTDTAAAWQKDMSQPWTLQECIAYAQTHNITVMQQQLNVRLAQADLLQSKGNVLPNLNAGASHMYQYGRTVDRYTNTFANSRVLSENFFITSSVTVFSGLQNYNSIRQNQFSLEASKYSVQQTQYDIGMNVASAYLNILFAEEQLALAQQQYDLTKAQVDRQQIILDAGGSSRDKLLDLQAQLANEEVNVISAQNSITISYLNLTQLMNLDSTAGFRIVKPDIAAPDGNLLAMTPEQIYQSAILFQPGIKSAQMSYQSADKGVSVAKGAYSPSVVLQGSLGTGYSGLAKDLTSSTYTGVDTVGATTGGDYVLVPTYSNTFVTTPFMDQFNNNANKSFGVQVNIPIFNRFQVSSNIERAKIQRENAQLNIDLAEQQLYKNIQQAYADAKAALLKYQASEKAVTAAQEAFKFTEEKFNAGGLDGITYNNSKNQLALAQSNLLQAKYDYVFRMKILDYYQGKPLTF